MGVDTANFGTHCWKYSPPRAIYATSKGLPSRRAANDELASLNYINIYAASRRYNVSVESKKAEFL